MTPQELRRLVNDTLVAAGFTKHFKSWILSGDEVSWIVSIDKRPSTMRYSLELGTDFHSIPKDKSPQDSNHCQIVLYPERLDLKQGVEFGVALGEALDLGAELDDDERESRIRDAVNASVGFMQDRTTIEALSRSFYAGELIGFVLKQARALLEVVPG